MWALVVNTCETLPRTPRSTWEKFSKTCSLALFRCRKSWWNLGFYYIRWPILVPVVRWDWEKLKLEIKNTYQWSELRVRSYQSAQKKLREWKNKRGKKKKKRPTDCALLLKPAVTSCFFSWLDWLPQGGFCAKISQTKNLGVILDFFNFP